MSSLLYVSTSDNKHYRLYGSPHDQMDAFVFRKRPRLAPDNAPPRSPPDTPDEGSTEMKLALLLSVCPDRSQEFLLDILVSCGGSVEGASSVISAQQQSSPEPGPGTGPETKKRGSSPAIQTSLLSYMTTSKQPSSPRKKQQQPPTKKGRTIHLFTPESIAAHTPCTLLPNYLPPNQANTLLSELLHESHHFSRPHFQLFDRTVQSPHSASVYVSTPEEYHQQTAEYTYGGTYRSNVRQIPPIMRDISGKVQDSVNEEIRNRIREVYPQGRKLKYQSSKIWRPNTAFVNCYNGPGENVGWHSDELTYLGPRPVIGSLSLGVEREFRVRCIAPTFKTSTTSTGEDDGKDDFDNGDAQGQISIHLPHNSLLIMHAEMQEEWKHSIAPAQTVSPHPVSGNRRINITYRCYRNSLNPRYTPRCRCGMHAVLRCAQRKRETRGRYMWMCYAGYAPGKKGCSFFQWAEFDDDGEPLWAKKPIEDDAPSLGNFVDSQPSNKKEIR